MLGNTISRPCGGRCSVSTSLQVEEIFDPVPRQDNTSTQDKISGQKHQVHLMILKVSIEAKKEDQNRDGPIQKY